jgi:hypothetical protein
MITNQTFTDKLLPVDEYNNCTFIDCYFEPGLITLNNCKIMVTQNCSDSKYASKLVQTLLKEASKNGKN